MAYKIINRNDGFVVLPNGEKVERHGFTVVESINQGYTRMEKRNLISIHPFFPEKAVFPFPPQEGSCYIVGDRSYRYTKGLWEEKEVKPVLLPVPPKDGFQYHTDDRVYERQGKHWVSLGGRNSVGVFAKDKKKLEAMAEERFSVIEKQEGRASFKKNPLTNEIQLMIDITGVDLIKFAQDIYDITPLTGKAGMLGADKNIPLEKLATIELIDTFKRDELVALKMQRINGRDCKMIVYRGTDKSLMIEANWLGHSVEDLRELLGRHNIQL